MPQIVGTLDSGSLANSVIADLLSAGFTKDDISLVMSDKAKAHFNSAGKDTGDRTVVDTAIGAGTGGVLGALLAGLTMVGGILIPGAQVFAVGPLVAALAGGGAGAALGGLAGAFSALGIAGLEANDYANDIKGGKAVIVIHTKDDRQTQLARSVLMSQGAGIKAA